LLLCRDFINVSRQLKPAKVADVEDNNKCSKEFRLPIFADSSIPIAIGTDCYSVRQFCGRSFVACRRLINGEFVYDFL
jgi:hypothetical protein